MVTCTNKEKVKQSLLSNGNVTVDCDNPKEYGGEGYVFGPHDFIEAGLASCMNAGIRRMCDDRGVQYEKIVTTVTLNHDDPETTFIKCKVDIIGAPENIAKEIAELGMKNCLVRETISKKLDFEMI